MTSYKDKDLANVNTTAADERKPMHRNGMCRSDAAQSLQANPIDVLLYFSAALLHYSSVVLLASSFIFLLH